MKNNPVRRVLCYTEDEESGRKADKDNVMLLDHCSEKCQRGLVEKGEGRTEDGTASYERLIA
jgi:hypothetical protein